jgi:hypothetical protein
MAGSSEVKLPKLFYQKAEEDKCTPGEVAQRIFREHILKEKPHANPDHAYFLLQTNTANDRIEFMGSFRNKFTAIARGRQMIMEDMTYGECGPLYQYFAFDIEGKWYHPPLSTRQSS